MKQAVLTDIKKFKLQDVPEPQITDGEVLLKVHAVGICGSDIHTYHGKHPFVHPPIVLGHEAAGEIASIGSKVTNLKIGDRVVMRPQKNCGVCAPCRAGRYNICEKLSVLGCLETGACSDFYPVDAKILYKLPDGVDFKVGTLIEPLAVGVHAVKRGISDVAGKNVLVIGAGTIGNLLAQAAKGMGAACVMVSDVSPFKLAMAKECGVDYCVDVRTEKIEQVITKRFGVDGPDVIYECSANDNALNQALDFARKGINIVIVAVYPGKVPVNLANVQDREYNLVGTLMYVHEDYVEAIKLLAAGKVNLKPLITKEFTLEQIADAYKYIEDHKDDVQKVILNI
jgi:L-iditol 2-dehydrogenase